MLRAAMSILHGVGAARTSLGVGQPRWGGGATKMGEDELLETGPSAWTGKSRPEPGRGRAGRREEEDERLDEEKFKSRVKWSNSPFVGCVLKVYSGSN